jgi:hypothetical protein
VLHEYGQYHYLLGIKDVSQNQNSVAGMFPCMNYKEGFTSTLIPARFQLPMENEYILVLTANYSNSRSYFGYSSNQPACPIAAHTQLKYSAVWGNKMAPLSQVENVVCGIPITYKSKDDRDKYRTNENGGNDSVMSKDVSSKKSKAPTGHKQLTSHSSSHYIS